MIFPGRSRPADLARRLAAVGKPGIADLVGVASRVAKPDESILIGGSLPLGLGNHASDIDVLLLAPDETDEADRPAGPFQFFVDGERIEVIRVDLTELRGVIDALFGQLGAKQCLDLAQEHRRLFSRVAFGCWVAGPAMDSTFEAFLVSTYHRAIVRRTAESVRHHALVAALAMEQGDGLVASWNARGALDAVLQYAVLRAGLPYAGSKWLYEQARTLPASATPWAAVAPLLRLPDTDAGRLVHARTCLAEVAAVIPLRMDLAELGRDAWWHAHALRPCRLAERWVLVDTAHHTVREVGAAESTSWHDLFGDRPEPVSGPIGAEGRLARELAWRLYIDGVIDIGWHRGMPE